VREAPAEAPPREERRQARRRPQDALASSVDGEARRRTLELLANPQMRKFAQEVFKKQGPDEKGVLNFDGLMGCLQTLHAKLDLPNPDLKKAEKLFKKFDANNDHSLAFEEFFELFKSALRRSAFDRSSMVRREFFVTKHSGDVWAAYTRVKELGAGTFGKAYLVKSKSSGDDAVVKAVQKSRTAMPLDDIEREILVMRQVDHPHVVRLFEWFEDSSRFYLVLEALKGGTLKEVLLMLQKQKKEVKETWTRKLMSQAIDGMAYVHGLRLIHKDLKDENIMLLKKDPNFDEPFAVIIDLGIAEMFSVADPAGREIGGTPTTMAPEVWKGTFGPKCDVFSLGCVLYELLSGNYPFMAMTLDPKSWMRLHKRGPDWSKVRTSDAGKDLCLKMLSYHEADRPTMKECRQHEYFTLDRRDLKAVPSEQFAHFSALCHENAVKRALLLDIAAALPLERAKEVIDLFENLDVDSSGCLSARELERFFRHAGIEDDNLMRNTFKVLDVDRDGKLSFSEFAAGALLLFKDMLEERLHDLFRRYDCNQNGSLDVKEAKSFLREVAAAVDQGTTDAKSSSTMKGLMQDAEGGRLTYEQLRSHICVPAPVPPASCPPTPSTVSTARVASSRLGSVRR